MITPPKPADSHPTDSRRAKFIENLPLGTGMLRHYDRRVWAWAEQQGPRLEGTWGGTSWADRR